MYLVFHGISVIGGDDNPACDKQWPSEALVTQAYDPSEIYSYPLTGEFVGVIKTPLNYADLWSNCTSSFPNYEEPGPCSGSPGCQSSAASSLSAFQAAMTHCFPHLSIPSGLQTLHTEWTTCISTPGQGLGEEHGIGIFDPPQVLVPGDVMAGPTSTREDSLIATKAAPSLAALQSQPSKTPAPLIPIVSNEHIKSSAPGSSQVTKSVDPAPSNLDSSTPDPGKPALADEMPTNNHASVKAADPEAVSIISAPTPQPAGRPAADPTPDSGVPFLIPAEAGLQSPSTTLAVPGQVEQDPADRGGLNAATSGQPKQQQQQQNQQEELNQLAQNAQSPWPGPLIQATEIQSHYIQATLPSNAIAVSSQIALYGGPTVQVAGTAEGGTTLAANVPALPHAGKPFFFGGGGLAIGSSTIDNPMGNIVSNAGDTIATLLPNGNVAMEGTIVTPNSVPVNLAGNPISLGSGRIDTIATLLPNGKVAMGGTIIVPDSVPVALASTPVSLGSSDIMVSGSLTINSDMSPPTTTLASGKAMSANSQSILQSSAVSGSTSLSSPAISESNLQSSAISGSESPSFPATLNSGLTFSTGSASHAQASTAAGERTVVLRKEILGAVIAVPLLIIVV